MKNLALVLVTLLSTTSAFAAPKVCGENQKAKLHRYTEAGNASSKVTTVEIIVSGDKTTFVDRTNSKGLIIGMDGEQMYAKRVGNKFTVAKSLLDVYELNVEWVDHPFVMAGGEVMIAKMNDTQYLSTNKNGCLVFRDGNSEH